MRSAMLPCKSRWLFATTSLTDCAALRRLKKITIGPTRGGRPSTNIGSRTAFSSPLCGASSAVAFLHASGETSHTAVHTRVRCFSSKEGSTEKTTESETSSVPIPALETASAAVGDLHAAATLPCAAQSASAAAAPAPEGRLLNSLETSDDGSDDHCTPEELWRSFGYYGELGDDAIFCVDFDHRFLLKEEFV